MWMIIHFQSLFATRYRLLTLDIISKRMSDRSAAAFDMQVLDLLNVRLFNDMEVKLICHGNHCKS